MNKLKRTGINVISGGAGYFLPMMVNFLATPLILSKLGEDGYGLQSLVNVVMGYLMVADMGLDIPITKLLAEYNVRKNLLKRNSLLNTTFQIYFCIGLVGMFLIMLIVPYIQGLFNIPQYLVTEAKKVFLITGIGFLGNIICMWGKALFIGIQRYDIANGIYLFFNLVSTIFGIILIYYNYGIVYFILVRVIGFFLAAITYFISGLLLLDGYKFALGLDKIILQTIRPLIGYGFLLRISGMIFTRLDQTLISAWISIQAVGIYSILLLITTAISGLISSAMNFTFPRASELFSIKDNQRLNDLFLSSTKYVSILSSFIFGFVIVAGDKFLLFWVGEEIADSGYLSLIILSIAYCINAISVIIINNFVVAGGGMSFYTYYNVSRGLIVALGFFLLIKPFGIRGAAISILLACLWDIAYVLLSSRKKYVSVLQERFIKDSLAKPLMLAIVSGLILIGIKSFITNWATLLLMGMAYILSFVYFGFILKVLNQKEKQILMYAFKKIIRFKR